MKYIIHGATGAQGAPLFNKLIAEGKPAIAAVRDPASLEEAPAVAIDLSSVDSLVAAYTGAEGVFVHLPLGPESVRKQFAHNIAKAVAVAKPARVVVSTSGWPLEVPGDESALPMLVGELEKTGVSLAVIAPQLYLENLLLPVVIEPVKTEHQLPYPLGGNYPVSWCSHLDIADVAAALLTEHAVTGIVGVGQLPAITGNDLAAAFARHFGHAVVFHSLTPEEFGERITPLFGSAAAEVVAVYKAKAFTANSAIEQQNSAQTLLGIKPRTVEKWLSDMGV
ncbi:SDR family oxidoreductase [Marinobacter sp.]|uniref:SDR family oxidoreductase n=1 Tax=Marinobacter sp. TaxID=50741 RepID=UPI0019D9FF1D|nr:NAD(P)H-binding protein [Marinobacter sp.]MBE0487258.1 NAD(P)H-binding protein [Marinobacter sp.]